MILTMMGSSISMFGFLVALLMLVFCPRPTDAINATKLDCDMRLLALAYGKKVHHWRTHYDPLWNQIHDALELTSRCDIPRPRSTTTTTTTTTTKDPLEDISIAFSRKLRDSQREHSEEKQPTPSSVPDFCLDKKCIYVSPKACEGDGSIQHPLGSTYEALQISRRMPKPLTIVLREGIHTLQKTLNLGKRDQGLTVRAYPGEEAWLSGGIRISDHNTNNGDTIWRNHKTIDNSTKIMVTDLGQLLGLDAIPPRVSALFSTDRRWIRARYPNSDPEIHQWGYATPNRYGHCIATNPSIIEWKRPAKGKVPTFTYYDFANDPPPGIPVKNDSIMDGYNLYASGHGGVCSDLWGAMADSYWCSNASAGGWAEVDQECAVTGQLQIPSGFSYNTSHSVGERINQYKNAKGAFIYAWHSQSWSMHMFEVATHSSKSGEIEFTKDSGKQGGRNWCRCDQCTYAGYWCGQHQDPPNKSDERLIGGDWLIENVKEELDAVGEFYFDSQTKSLYVIPNTTTELSEFRFAMLSTLVNINGTSDIEIINVGFRDVAPTFMDDWSAPSGGDWALHRGGALMIENSTDILVQGSTFRRLDGNAIFLSRRTRRVKIYRNTFEWLGENAVATWGDTNHFDATAGDFPLDTEVVGNVMREIGIYQKQSSGVGQAKAAKTLIRGNIMFNMPRAAINLNDGLGGGDSIEHNLIFNTCRESGDHGPINTWDRQPFLTTLKFGSEPSFSPLMRTIAYNYIFANYGAAQGVDNDDGSSWFHIHHNIWYDSEGFKMDYGGHDSIFEFNLVISYPDHFSQNCVGFGSFFPGRGHTSRYNKCIVPHNDREGISLQHCRNSNAVLHDNEYYSPNGTLLVHCWDDDEGPVPFEEAQESFGIEKGSSIHNTPDQSDILLWSAELLLSEGILYKYE